MRMQPATGLAQDQVAYLITRPITGYLWERHNACVCRVCNRTIGPPFLTGDAGEATLAGRGYRTDMYIYERGRFLGGFLLPDIARRGRIRCVLESGKPRPLHNFGALCQMVVWIRHTGLRQLIHGLLEQPLLRNAHV